jgi:hypothetical protein
VSALERRYRALLRAYPRAYRAERGDEIVGTLLDDSRPDQRWPSGRDVRALALGGLRQRAGADRLPEGTLWRDALALALVMVLVSVVVARLGRTLVLPGSLAEAALRLVTAVMATGALVALLLRRFGLGLLLVALTAGLFAWSAGPWLQSEIMVAQVPVLAAAIGVAVAARRGHRTGGAPPRTTATLVAVAAVLAVPMELAQAGSPLAVPAMPFALMAVSAALAVVAAAVDPRLPVAVAMVAGWHALPSAYLLGSVYWRPWPATLVAFVGTEIGLALVLVPLGWALARRRARV